MMIPAVDDGPYYDCLGCGCSLRWDECEADAPMCVACQAAARDEDEEGGTPLCSA